MGLSKSKVVKETVKIVVKEEAEVADNAFVNGKKRTKVVLLVFLSSHCLFVCGLALNRAGSIEPSSVAVEPKKDSIKIGQIKPLPKRKTLDAPTEQMHLTKEAWFLDASSGDGGKSGVSKEQSELLRKYYVLIEAPSDPKVRKD